MPDVPPELEQSTLLRRRGDVLWRTGDQFLALARVDGHPLTVSGPGADVWARLEREQSWAELARGLADDYGVDVGRIATDLGPILQRLVDEGYVDARA